MDTEPGIKRGCKEKIELLITAMNLGWILFKVERQEESTLSLEPKDERNVDKPRF